MYDERNYIADLDNSNFGAINRRSTNQSNFPPIQLGLKLLWWSYMTNRRIGRHSR
jgi:hypothetical protein